jgi:hypothetical protein
LTIFLKKIVREEEAAGKAAGSEGRKETMDTGSKTYPEDLRSDDAVNQQVAVPRIADDEQGDRQSMEWTAELTRFDRSRRKFLKLSGLTIAGLLLPNPFWQNTEANAALVTARIDRAVAWALQDVSATVVTHVPATGATAIFDAYNELMGTPPCYAFNEEVAYTLAHGAALAGGPLSYGDQIPRHGQGGQQRD